MTQFFRSPTYAKDYLRLAQEQGRRPKWWEPLLQIVTQSAANIGETAAKKAIFNALMTPEEKESMASESGLRRAQQGLATAQAGAVPEQTRMPLQVAERQGQSQIQAAKVGATPALIEALKPGKRELSFEEMLSLERAKHPARGAAMGKEDPQAWLKMHPLYPEYQRAVGAGQDADATRIYQRMLADRPGGPAYAETLARLGRDPSAKGGVQVTPEQIALAAVRAANTAKNQAGVADLSQLPSAEKARLLSTLTRSQKSLTTQSLTSFQDTEAAATTGENAATIQSLIDELQGTTPAAPPGVGPAAASGAAGTWSTL